MTGLALTGVREHVANELGPLSKLVCNLFPGPERRLDHLEGIDCMNNRLHAV